MAEHTDTFELTPPKDFSYHYSDVAKQRVASKIKQFYKYFSIPGIANLAGGLPHPSYFPFDTLESKSALPQRFKPTPNNPVGPPATTKNKNKDKHNAYLNDPTSARVLVPHDSHQPNLLHRIDLRTALQYGTAQGYPPLYGFIREFALTRLHPNIPYKNGAEIVLTCGSTDGFAKSIECFTNPWIPGKPLAEREGLLCEEFAYMNAIQTARPRGLNIVPVAIDAEGMLAYGHPNCLYNVLSNWDVEKHGGKRPHIMYTVTMGQNPTSGLLSVRRRKEIYECCQKFDVLIVEDDPYFYIQFPHAANEFTQKHRDGALLSINHFAESNLNYQTSLAVPVRGQATTGCNGHSFPTTRMRRGKSSGSPFLDSLVPSYLSIDVDGRVIRLDTFSKTIAPGCRLGWITAQPEIVERILRITECSTQQPSGFVQSLVAELLIGPDHADKTKNSNNDKAAQGWKMDGWIRWLEGLRGNYERRMRVMSEVLEEGKCTTSSRTSISTTATISTGQPRVRPSRRTSDSDDNDDFEVLQKTQIYDFNPPMAGMFLWLRLHLHLHPLADSFPLERLSRAFWIFQTKEPYLVLLAPGTLFAPTDSIREEKGWKFMRLCFAAVDEEDVRGISERFVRGCHDFWDLSESEVQGLLDEDESGMEKGMGGLEIREGGWMVGPGMC